jgi:uncharacterized membrane protein (UPF0127 family)
MKINLKNKPFNIKVVHTREDLTNGMMGKNFDDFDGMLFVMPKKGAQSFWMKNCIVPLDIIFLSKKKIKNISHDCPPCADDNCPTYNGWGDFVLELPGGTCKKLGLNIGDEIDYGI